MKKWDYLVEGRQERLAHIKKQQAEYKKSVETFLSRKDEENKLVYDRLKLHKRKPGSKTSSREFSSYKAMIERCYNPDFSAYKYYGGRGIKVWRKWLGKGGFEEFLHAMGNRPAGTSLERVNIKKNYYPNNCIWADKYTQASNKSDNVYIKFDGETKTLADWARKMGIKATTINSRLKAGWTTAQAFGLDLPKNRRIVPVRELTYRNQTKTLKEWSKKVDVSLQVLKDRYDEEWPPSEILGYKAHKRDPTGKGLRGMPIGLTYKGKTRSVYEWAKIRKISVVVIKSRIRKKWDIEDVLDYDR